MGTRSGKQKEDGGAEMSDPPCEEQRDRRFGQIRGTDVRGAKEIAGMVQCHENHGDATHDINRFDTQSTHCHPASLLTHWYNAQVHFSQIILYQVRTLDQSE